LKIILRLIFYFVIPENPCVVNAEIHDSRKSVKVLSDKFVMLSEVEASGFSASHVWLAGRIKKADVSRAGDYVLNKNQELYCRLA